jgi:hypothetical protein
LARSTVRMTTRCDESLGGDGRVASMEWLACPERLGSTEWLPSTEWVASPESLASSSPTRGSSGGSYRGTAARAAIRA